MIKFKLLKMYKRYSQLAEDLASPLVVVELEARMIIEKPLNFKPDNEVVIEYFRSTRYPSITFRKYGDKLESKELVEKVKLGKVTIALSIEQSYNCSNTKLGLVKISERKICRQTIPTNPPTEITRVDNQFTVEIEFDITNYMKIESMLKEWLLPYWPSIKPMEISSVALAKKLSMSKEWAIAVKADGEHILIYENNDNKIFLYDNGLVTDEYGKECDIITPTVIYEAEIMDNKTILIYDCLKYNNKNIMKLNYFQRRKYIYKNKKDIIIFNSVYGLKAFIYEPHSFKSDGYIITNIKNRNIVYKAKFINTVDLLYKNGILYLENEIISDRKPNNELYPFKNNHIYEFDTNMNLLRERKDKIIPNYKFPYDDNPLYKIIYGIGIPSLRCYHNKIKFLLLSKLPKEPLLDIGSAKGGDIDKWLKLSLPKIYAVDPYLSLRYHYDKIIEIKDYAKNIPSSLVYSSISLLFVPWSDEFYSLIDKTNNLIMACMTDPINYECLSYSCEIVDNKIKLTIPETVTATVIQEIKIDYQKLFESLKKKGWKHEEIHLDMVYGTKEEKILRKMYTYHYFKRQINLSD